MLRHRVYTGMSPMVQSMRPVAPRHLHGDHKRASPMIARATIVGTPCTAADIERELLAKATSDQSPPIIIFFTAPWCGPCKIVYKELVKLGGQSDKLKILTVDIDAEKDFAVKLAIGSVPTLLFVGSAPADTPALMTQGVVTKALMADILDNKLQYAGADLYNPRKL